MRPTINRCVLILSPLVVGCAPKGMVVTRAATDMPIPPGVQWNEPRVVFTAEDSEFERDTAFTVNSEAELAALVSTLRGTSQAPERIAINDRHLLVVGAGDLGHGSSISIDSIGHRGERSVWVAYRPVTECSPIQLAMRPVAVVELPAEARDVRVLRGPMKRDADCGARDA